MPKIKMPRSAPSIDMTPMVDLAFLLVTFFMLSASFRQDDVVSVNTPSSISDEEVPDKHLVMVTVDAEGRIYFGASGEETKRIMLDLMCKQYNIPLSKEQKDNFAKMTNFGCSMSQLPDYLNLSSEERKRNLRTVPADSTNGRNELKDWIYNARIASLQTGEQEYKKASETSQDPVDADDFKPKFVLKVDGKAQYAYAKLAIESFRQQDINNLNFVTSLEDNPYGDPGGPKAEKKKE